MGMGRALAVSGDLDEARRHRAEAIATADGSATRSDRGRDRRVRRARDLDGNDDEALSARSWTVAEHTGRPARRPLDTERAC